MFSSIFSRLVAIIMAILLIGFSITGAMLYFYLSDFTLKEKTRLLEVSAKEISRHFEQYVKNLNNARQYEDPDARSYLIETSKYYFEQYLKSYGEYTNSLVWIVSEDGYILFRNPELSESLLNSLVDDTGFPKLPDERQYKKVFAGQDAFVREIGDFYGFFKDASMAQYGQSWLTVELPVAYSLNSASQDLVAVYLHTPVPEVHRVRTAVYWIFLRSVGVAILVSLILVYIFSRRLTSPIKQMNEAVKVIAGGEFSKRVNVASQDEVGELANSFNHMVVALQKLEDMRRGFIANISHELRTPMTSIRGFIEGILDGTIPRERHEYYLTIVRDETNRLNRLVNDLLDLARMEAGEVELNIRSFDINELLRRCVLKLESLITGKELQVEADFEEESLLVSADVDAIERVVYNLLHNAIKFTPEKGKITLGTRVQREKVLIWVQDTGVGIDSEEIDLIWDRFYKGDKSRSNDKTGTGLGLAIIKNIINEHKQKIWVESEPEKGARFIFTLERSAGLPEE